MAITMELLAKLSEWQAAGRRVVKIEKDSLESNIPEWRIWIYDYDVEAGIRLKAELLDQDFDKLIVTKQREELLRKMAELDKKIGGAA